MKKNIFITIGLKTREERLKKGYTIQELADKTGINAQYIKKIEEGKAIRMTTKHLFVIAHALKLKPHELL